MILVLDTSSENTFLGLYHDDWLAKEDFLGGRELNSLIFLKLDNLFKSAKMVPEDLKGIIVNSGPGSFTGLRIGISIANTFAYTLDIPIVGVRDTSETHNLLQKGLSMLKSRDTSFSDVVVPHYGAEPHITKPKPKG